MREVELQDVAEIIAGQSPKSEFYNEKGEGVPFFQGKTDFGDDYPTVTTWCTKPKKMAEEGDILFSVRAPVGPTNIAKVDCCIGRGLSAIRLGKEIERSYLRYFFKKIEEKISDQGRGSTFKAITQKDLKALKIPLPTLSEQKAIVAKLDRSQRLIDIDRQMLAKYDELIQSVFLEMFGDPVRNEMGWEVKKLGDVGILARGKSKHRPRNDPSILGGKYPLIQTGDVSNAGLFITDYDSTYNEDGLKQSKLWEKGTLCITIAANIAKVGILDFDACFPDSVVGFKSDKASSMYIYTWMGFLQSIIEEQAPVSAQKNINLRILRDLDITFPPFELQRKFESTVLKIHDERKLTSFLNKKSEELFSSFVQRTFK